MSTTETTPDAFDLDAWLAEQYNTTRKASHD